MIRHNLTSPLPLSLLPEALSQCREKQRAWRRLSMRERLKPVRAFRRLLVDHCDDLCSAVQADIDKPAQETIAGELLPLADACQFLEKKAAKVLSPKSTGFPPLWMFGQSDVVHRRPRGVIGIIGTWNYPLMLNGVQILQALTAGNGVLWKPSEVAPHSAKILWDLLERASYPTELMICLEATREAGPAVTEAEIDHLVFTGAAATGRIIARRLGERLISSTLELSGCDAAVVFEDANLELTASAIRFGCTLNRGQTCIAVRRVFAHESILSSLEQALRSRFEHAPKMRLALASQVEQAQDPVESAIEQGAEPLLDRDAFPDTESMFPVVLTKAKPEMRICREASFAPITVLIPFTDTEEVVRMDEQCPYALGASIFTSSPKKAKELGSQLRVGSVSINDVIAPTANAKTPFGGEGDSGWGVTQGSEGLLEMTVPQVIAHKRGTFRPHYDMTSTNAGDQETMVRGLLEMSHGSSFGRRWKGFWKMIRGLRGSNRTKGE